MGIIWYDKAWKQYLDWQENDKKALKRLNELIKECQRTPFEGQGKPEHLKGELSGYMSRRIDEKNRLVYKVTEENVIIISCKTHYNQK